MPTATIDKTYSLPGYTSRQARVSRSADHASVWGGADAPITLNAAFPVTDFTEGDPNEASCNLAGGHGIGDGAHTTDVYWTESGVNKIRYGVTNTISTNACALTGGAGDDYPATIDDGLCVICEQIEVFTSIDGDQVSMFWAVLDFGNVLATGRGHVDFQETNDTQVGEIDIEGILQGVAGVDYDIEGGVSNPLTGNPILEAEISHNDTTYTPTFELVVLADSTA